MSTTTVRIPEEKKDFLRFVASVERKDIKDILSEQRDEYLVRQNETLEIISRSKNAFLGPKIASKDLYCFQI